MKSAKKFYYGGQSVPLRRPQVLLDKPGNHLRLAIDRLLLLAFYHHPQ
jgi:hypothetical protein